MYRRLAFRDSGVAAYHDESARRLVVYDHQGGRELLNVETCAAFAGALAWETPLALGSNSDAQVIDVWDFAQGSHHQVALPRTAGRLHSDRTGQRIIYAVFKGIYAFDLRTKQELPVVTKGSSDLLLAFDAFSPTRNHLLIPVKQKGILLRMDFEAFTAAPLELAIQGTAQWVQVDPAVERDRFAVVDRSNTLHMFAGLNPKPDWSTRLKPAMQAHESFMTGSFSGDGSLLTAIVGRRTILIDALTGKILQTRDGASMGSPYRGSLVFSDPIRNMLDSPTAPQTVIDLATGERRQEQVRAK